MPWDPQHPVPPTRMHCVCVCVSPGATRTHKWSYSGSCPKSLEDSSWIPFRDHCYTFHMEITLGQKDAMRRCQKGTGRLQEKRGPRLPLGAAQHPKMEVPALYQATSGQSSSLPSAALRWGSPCTMRFTASSGSSALSSPLLPLPCSILQALGFPLTPLSSTVGGTVLSIQDETENVFVWEHLQAYEGPSKGAWLGMTFNPKGTKEGGRL